MVGVLGELLLQHAGRRQVRRVALIGLRLRSREVERVEDLRLVVARILGRERFERAGPIQLARALWTVRPVLVVGRDGVDVVALALGLGADLSALIDRGLRPLGPLRARPAARERVGHQEGGDPPRRDRARRVLGQHFAERLLTFREPERVQHGDAAQERFLDGGGTRVLEVDLAELHLAQDRGREHEDQRQRHDECACFHGGLLRCDRQSTMKSFAPVAVDERWASVSSATW